MFGSCCIMLLKRYQMISISPKHLEPSQMKRQPINSNSQKPWIGWCLCRIHQSESQIIWSVQSKAWYNKLIFLHDGIFFFWSTNKNSWDSTNCNKNQLGIECCSSISSHQDSVKSPCPKTPKRPQPKAHTTEVTVTAKECQRPKAHARTFLGASYLQLLGRFRLRFLWII